MPPVLFPDAETADENGLVGIGGDLTVETLIGAYRKGIFPWPHEGYPLLWFSPNPRAVLFFEEIHVPDSLEKARKKSRFSFTIDKAFAEVIQNCKQAQRPGQGGTWISDEMNGAYLDFHRAGYAHSAECWDGSRLVGGIYGVDVDGVFCGESMFFLKPNASKFAFLHLVEHLKNHGATWMDIQVLTPHMQALGAREIPRKEYLTMLAGERLAQRKLFPGHAGAT